MLDGLECFDVRVLVHRHTVLQKLMVDADISEVRNRLGTFTKVFLEYPDESVDFVGFAKHLEIVNVRCDQHNQDVAGGFWMRARPGEPLGRQPNEEIHQEGGCPDDV